MTGPAPSVRQADLFTRTFLAMQSVAANPTDLYIGALLRSSGSAPDIASLRAHVSRHLPAVPELTHRAAPAQDGGVRWEPDPHFDIEAHVMALPKTQAPPDAVPAGSWLGDAPDPDRPLWRMLLLRGPGAEWALAYLVHHAAQDGTAMIRTLEVLFGDNPAVDPVALPVRGHRPWHALLAVPALLGTQHPAPRVTMMATPPDAARVLTHRSVDLADLRSIAASAGATIGQVHLAAVAGAIRRWSPDDFTGVRQRDVPVCVPLDTRVAGEEAAAGSLIGLLRVALPSAEDDPRRRLRAASRRLARGKVRRNRLGLRAVSEDLPARCAAFAVRRVGNRRTVAFTVSTYRPLRPLRILGSPVEHAVAIPWLPPRANCFSILLTYGGQATFSVLTDGTVDRTRDLASCWADEVHQMRAAEQG
jgi:hypothetical protein